jgi:hypothetical protein
VTTNDWVLLLPGEKGGRVPLINCVSVDAYTSVLLRVDNVEPANRRISCIGRMLPALKTRLLSGMRLARKRSGMAYCGGTSEAPLKVLVSGRHAPYTTTTSLNDPSKQYDLRCKIWQPD